MATRAFPMAAWSVPVLGLVPATATAVVVQSDVVLGPAVQAAPGRWLVTFVAATLVAAAVAASTVLPRAPFPWHTDGVMCAALLLPLAATVVAGWQHAPDVLRSAAAIVAPLTVPLLLALVERRTRDTVRWSVIAAAVVGALSLARAAVREPFDDPDCWVDCSLRDVAPLASTEAARWADVGLDMSLLLAAAVAASSTVRWAVGRAAPGVGRVELALAVCASLAAACWAAATITQGRETVVRLVVAALAAEAATASLVVVAPTLAVRRRRTLRGLAELLGDQPLPGTLESTLRRLLGDPQLRVAYWLPESHRYVDAAGDAVDTASGTAVALQRDGQPLALVVLGDAGRDRHQLLDLIGPAARLAIDSERLRAEVSAQLADATAARRRLIAAADQARREVERTLHDEVQSELVGALLDVAHHRTGQAATPTTLAEGIRALVGDIREFSRGIHPAVLDAAGLPAALEALAEEAPVPLHVDCRLAGRPPLDVERAAYLLVHDAVARATGALGVTVDDGASCVRVTVEGHPGEVREDLIDRVGALGGTVAVESQAMRAVLPCG